MEDLQKRFPFLKHLIVAENTSTRYCKGFIREKRVLVSQKGTQWILTIDGEYITASVDSEGPIIDTLEKLQTGDVLPNGLAIFLSRRAVERARKEHPYPGLKENQNIGYHTMPCDWK